MKYNSPFFKIKSSQEVVFWPLGAYEPIMKNHKNIKIYENKLSAYILAFYVRTQVFGEIYLIWRV
jgi:hypothetical protein